MSCVRRHWLGAAMINYRATLRTFVLLLALEVALVAGAIILICSTANAATSPPAPPAARTAQTMPKCILPRFVRLGVVRVKGKRIDTNQRKVLLWIVNEGHRRHLSKVVVLSAIAATTQEAGARELAHGTGTSLGPWQLIDSWGTPAQRISVQFSGTWYYNRAVVIERRQPGITIAALAQAVEVSAFPTAYRQWVPEARRTLARINGPCQLRS